MSHTISKENLSILLEHFKFSTEQQIIKNALKNPYPDTIYGTSLLRILSLLYYFKRHDRTTYSQLLEFLINENLEELIKPMQNEYISLSKYYPVNHFLYNNVEDFQKNIKIKVIEE